MTAGFDKDSDFLTCCTLKTLRSQERSYFFQLKNNDVSLHEIFAYISPFCIYLMIILMLIYYLTNNDLY